MADKRPHYLTTWYPKRGGPIARYKTLTLTGAHKRCRDHSHGPAETFKVDPSVDWPFGVYSEVIATGGTRFTETP